MPTHTASSERIPVLASYVVRLFLTLILIRPATYPRIVTLIGCVISRLLILVRVKFRANVAMKVHARVIARDRSGRRIEGRAKPEWIDVGTQFGWRFLAVGDEGRSHDQGVWAGRTVVG